MFCSVMEAREGKNGPQKEELKDVYFCIVVVVREGNNGPQNER
jgi:hypothetical protein